MTTGFWKNWEWRKVDFNDSWYVTLEFFANNYQHVENTMLEAVKRLGTEEFYIRASTGGGFVGSITYNSDTFKEIN